MESPPTSTAYWTRKQIITSFREWNSVHGEPPTSTLWHLPVEYVDGHRAWPSTSTVVGVFGSWNRAMAAAGFKTRKTGQRRKYKVKWTRENVIELIQEWVEAYGFVPGLDEFQSSGRASRSSIYRLFDSWNEAVKAAGFIPRPAGVTQKSISKYLIPPKEESPDVQS